jgi:thiamine biosynthesis lipoprotein
MAIDLLRSRGIGNAIVNAGGDLRAIGRHGNRPWRIGVRDPRGEGVLAAIDTEGDESVFTSGDYERYFVYQGRRYHHIIDPRDGYPTQGVTSVTVIHREAALADAAATALFVAGPGDWPRVAALLGVEQVMLVETSGTIQMTPEMEARTWLMPDPKPEVTIRRLPAP